MRTAPRASLWGRGVLTLTIVGRMVQGKWCIGFFPGSAANCAPHTSPAHQGCNSRLKHIPCRSHGNRMHAAKHSTVVYRHTDAEPVVLQPPQPLEQGQREKQAYQRELKTVTVGECCQPLPVGSSPHLLTCQFSTLWSTCLYWRLASEKTQLCRLQSSPAA